MFKPDYLVVVAVIVIALLVIFTITTFADDEELIPYYQKDPTNLRADCEIDNGCFIENASLYYGDVMYNAGGGVIGKITPEKVCLVKEGYTIRPSTNKIILECSEDGNITKR